METVKVWIVNNLARQLVDEHMGVFGDYCFNFVEYASTEKAKVEAHYENHKSQKIQTISTPVGDMRCLVERGIIEIDVED